ncbi:MAG: hypothetical protein AMJ54_03040 [Deltaproteobacteria bacterium SG8_13]|nr:MAG: hypothetical protein AMJ54_03040 [Deltaproteobacteria bacterium SG8_13]
MAVIESMLSITTHPGLSLLIWCAVLLLALYLGRNYAHQFIRSICRGIYSAMRLAASEVGRAEKRLAKRNREVLIARGMEGIERRVDRELSQMNTAVVKNARSYAALHHRISESIAHIDDDHRNSMDVPPSLPNWKPVIEAIAKIEHPGDAQVTEMLTEIHRLLQQQHVAAMNQHRNATRVRHSLLDRMLPLWTRTEKALRSVEQSMASLAGRAEKIDTTIQNYRQMQADTDSAVRVFSSSALTEFVTSALFLAVAAGGALINFDLIALPLAEITGSGTTIGPYKTAKVVAGVMTAAQLSLGLLLMESLRITRLFLVIGRLEKHLLTRITWIALTLLVVLAGVESTLALLRENMLADLAALKQALAGAQPSVVPRSAVPVAAQMAMGFILPFWIALGAIPLAAFLSSARMIAGSLGQAFLRLLAFSLRLLGQTSTSAGRVLTATYDLIIFPTLWLESTIGHMPRKSKQSEKPEGRTGFQKRSKKSSENEEQPGQLKESS